jgi:hypothetical protein
MTRVLGLNFALGLIFALGGHTSKTVGGLAALAADFLVGPSLSTNT